MTVKRLQKIFSSMVVTIIAVIFFFVNLTIQVNASMFGFFKKYDVHLSPVVQGQINLNGHPVPNQKVIRSLTYGDDAEQIEEVMTDQNGKFYFPDKNIRSSRPGSMFDESTVRQIVLIERDNKKYLLWYSDTFGIKPAEAISERLSALICDLNNSEETFEFPSIEHAKLNHFTYSICRW